MTEPWQSAPRS